MKHYVMELIGTFFLTVAISFTGNPLAIGLMFMAMIYMGQSVSGGHYNPAITLAVYLRGKMKSNLVLGYMISQLFGALLAVLLFNMVSGDVFMPEATPGLTTWVAVVLETLLSFVLCYVALMFYGTDQYKGNQLSGAAIGLTLTALAFIGGMFNPGVAGGALLFSMLKTSSMGAMKGMYVYLFGPLAGGACACHMMNYLYGKK